MSLVANRLLRFRKRTSLVDTPPVVPLLSKLALTKRVNSYTSWRDDKKLHLVLDLDHTLVQSIRIPQLSESEKYLIEEAESRKDLWRCFSESPCSDCLIKLRPFVHQFLKEASDMFSMSVYTKGAPYYAQKVLELIDPDKIYFGDRVISRRESPGISRTLDLVLADQRGIVIVDDTRRVWPRGQKNLLEIAAYEYFTKSNESYVASSECKEKRDESEEKGSLASLLRVLKQVHKGFFSDLSEQEFDSMDVRPLLQAVERKHKFSSHAGTLEHP